MTGVLVTAAQLQSFCDRLTVLESNGSFDTKEVDATSLFHASVNPVDIHNAGTTLGITETRADAGWTAAANGADYVGEPDSVEVTINVQVDENAASNYWAQPEIVVTRNGVRIGAASALLMQNNGTYSSQGTLSAHIVDPAPGVDPVYRFLLEDADNRTNEAIPQEHAHVALRAIEKCMVLVLADGSTTGGGTTTGTTLLPAANGKVVSDNFQDQQFIGFNLQVRNTTNAAVNWQAQVANVTYATIPNQNLNGATLGTTDNGDGTFTHLFSGTHAAFQSVTITGGTVSPSGNGSGLTLYCENI